MALIEGRASLPARCGFGEHYVGVSAASGGPLEKEHAMPGIIVGVDGSANARRALEWAMREAAIRQVPLTVLTVNEVAASFWTHRPIILPGDEGLLKSSREGANELVDKTAADLGESRPAEVTVKAVNGFAAAELINASQDADLVVVGASGGAHSGGLAQHMPLGSIANKVLHHAECPVVVVPARGGRAAA
jgi:nucleotide-binding universal stress UspA family protein